MSRGRRRKRGGRQQPAKKKFLKYVVPLAEWKRFERFKSRLPQIEAALNDLQENWNSHLNYIIEELYESGSDYENMHDNIIRLVDLIHGVEFASKKQKRQTYHESICRRPPHENMIAEIYVEDISHQPPHF